MISLDPNDPIYLHCSSEEIGSEKSDTLEARFEYIPDSVIFDLAEQCIMKRCSYFSSAVLKHI